VPTYHPIARGCSPLWPALEFGDPRHVLLQPELPMVGIRPLVHQVDPIDAIEWDSHQLAEVSPPAQKAVRPARHRDAVAGPVTMACRCPLCYAPIAGEVFHSKGHVWCGTVLEQIDGKPRTKAVHTTMRPRDFTDAWSETSATMLSADYLREACADPRVIRPVSVAGYSQKGKTTFLLSMAGCLYYPDGNDFFSRAFPPDLGYSRTPGAMTSLTNADRLNLFKSLEDVWIDGVLKPTTEVNKRALSVPIIFSTRHGKLVTIIHDIAGEAMGPDVALRESFPHVACSRDVI
jgi:hypothetical protein